MSQTCSACLLNLPSSNPFLNSGGNLAGLDASPFGTNTSNDGSASNLSGVDSSTWTPSDATPGQSASGSVAGDVVDEAPLLENIQVKLAADGRKGTILEARTGAGFASYVVGLAGGDNVTVGREDVEIVRPAKKDKLIILKGDLAGSTGTLIGIDGSDGIVKMAANSDIKILDLELCAKMGDGLG